MSESTSTPDPCSLETRHGILSEALGSLGDELAHVSELLAQKQATAHTVLIETEHAKIRTPQGETTVRKGWITVHLAEPDDLAVHDDEASALARLDGYATPDPHEERD